MSKKLSTGIRVRTNYENKLVVGFKRDKNGNLKQVDVDSEIMLFIGYTYEEIWHKARKAKMQNIFWGVIPEERTSTMWLVTNLQNSDEIEILPVTKNTPHAKIVGRDVIVY